MWLFGAHFDWSPFWETASPIYFALDRCQRALDLLLQIFILASNDIDAYLVNWAFH